ncbi:GMP/IMP nucleotidase [Methylococcus sp. EFPC2]|uniref:GMP/IMP nucleotidase n=1 Tax=Methylococcus sp. EFPC2 TaxID=2812648 RepID=UPI0019673581|nr:GMP/IMP nucleotidase [Methylococcus sp. EFPC2]QSA96578.1 GMP/IMP nucleotidase [Methylococcus sp. EFPC2]
MITWSDIDEVFLDMDGTLLDLNFDNHFWLEFVPQRYAEHHGLTPAEAKLVLQPRFKAMEGRLEWYCLDYWTEQLELDIAGMKQEIAGLIGVLPHATEFLQAVRDSGRRLVLVTNAHRKSLGLKLEKTSLGVYFDNIVSSHDLGAPKEAPEFWHALAEVEAYDAGRTLMVDDSLPVLRAARAHGLHHLVAVRKHDSTRPSRPIDEFTAIEDFRELMPVQRVAGG